MQVRHGPQMYRCRMTFIAQHPQSPALAHAHAHVALEENDQGLAPGQYAVFYQEGVCLGAAKIL